MSICWLCHFSSRSSLAKQQNSLQQMQHFKIGSQQQPILFLCRFKARNCLLKILRKKSVAILLPNHVNLYSQFASQKTMTRCNIQFSSPILQFSSWLPARKGCSCQLSKIFSKKFSAKIHILKNVKGFSKKLFFPCWEKPTFFRIENCYTLE